MTTTECGDCLHFRHARKDSGKIDRKHYGRCTFTVRWPVEIPMNYNFTPPTATAVWHNSNAEGCRCFKRGEPK